MTNWTPDTDRALTRALDCLARVWPKTLVAGHRGAIRVEFHVQAGAVNHLRYRYDDPDRPGEASKKAAGEAAALAREKLIGLLPQILRPGFHGSATLSIDVDDGRAVGIGVSYNVIQKLASAR